MSESSSVTAETVGRGWAEERWGRVYDWRHEHPFVRAGTDALDREEALRRAKSYGLPVQDAEKILAEACEHWTRLQASGGFVPTRNSSGCGRYLG